MAASATRRMSFLTWISFFPSEWKACTRPGLDRQRGGRLDAHERQAQRRSTRDRAVSDLAGNPGALAPPYGRITAMIRTGPPVPPSIFIGSATTVNPREGIPLSRSTFSKIGVLEPPSTRWARKSVDWP